MQDLPRVSRLAKTRISKRISKDTYWRGKGWPPDGDPFWYGYHHIAGHPWFERLWTFQEVVLGEEVLVLHGPASIDLRCILEFWNNRFHGLRNYTCIPQNVADTIPGFYTFTKVFDSACFVLVWRWLDLDGAAIEAMDLPDLFFGNRRRKSKEQVDRVWAIMGLLPERLRSRVSPGVDYSAQGRSHYWETFVLFAGAVYEEEQCLALLNIPPSTRKSSPPLPSWCPDFYTAEALCNLQIPNEWRRSVRDETGPYRTWFSIEENDIAADEQKSDESRAALLNHPMKLIKVNNNDAILYIRGFVVDTITEVADGTDLLQLRDAYGDLMYQQFANDFDDPIPWTLRNFLVRALNLCRRTCRPLNLDAKVPQEFVTSVLRDSRLNMEANRACEDLFNTFKQSGAIKHKELDKIRREAVDILWWKVHLTFGHSFFATQAGRFGTATPGCKSGDKICVFYGGEPLFVLPSGGVGVGSKPVKFGGTAFIPHMMDQDQRDAARLSEDEIFAIC